MQSTIFAAVIITAGVAAAVVDMVQEARSDRALRRSQTDHPAGRQRADDTRERVDG